MYKQVSANCAADALSRRTNPQQLLAISTYTPEWLEAVVASYANDPMAVNLVAKLSVCPTAVPNYTLSAGILRYKNRIWLSHDKNLHQQVISAMHSSALGDILVFQSPTVALSNTFSGLP